MRKLLCLLIMPLFMLSCNKEIEKKAPLFSGLGSYSMKITTNSDLAQRYFNQGIIFTYGFNHEEAFRSYQEAARLDPDCAMAYWGMALVLGPNINLPMDSAVIGTAYESIQKAISLLNNETQKEKDWVMALSKRYSKDKTEDRSKLDKAYADAMRELHRKYPRDLDIATMFAEALMDCHPWDYWLKDGTPEPWTPEILSTLEGVLKRNPDHLGANHFYIHSVEASKHPEIGLPSADKLRYLVPGAGHLVHMPSHIYIRTGKYHEGVLANERAVKSDEQYISQCRQQGFYPVSYYPHNYHFLWACATLEGNSKKAINAALRTAQIPPDSLMDCCGLQTLQHFNLIPLYAYVTFGRWDDILKYPEPKDTRPYQKGIWHYARGMAFTGMNNLSDAKKELASLNKLKDIKSVDDFDIWGINSAGSLLKIAAEVLAGEIAAKEKKYKLSIDHLKNAVGFEDALRYDEPPTWFYPTRNSLGAVLIEAGKYSEAQKVYEEDLKEYPENGWALFGLHTALIKQNKNAEAAAVEKRFKEAWKYSDIKLTSSRVM
jgi:tetratricopeptide (TPR) repeat protein